MLEHRCLLSITPSSVVGRFIFYDNSHYDGNTPGINSSDDSAIASDKSALLIGQATFANLTSYSRGINGIMVDISGSHPGVTVNDFTFKVGNNNMPGLWATAPPPTMVTVRAGAGAVSGSDRIEFVWADNAVQQQWLEVIVAADRNTGLDTSDVFFFGNEIGDTGSSNTRTVAKVGAADITGAQTHLANLNANIPVTNLYDFNRDGQVGALDVTLAQTRPTSNTTGLRLFNAPTTSSPALTALVNDTGTSNHDGITSDPTVSGTLTEANSLTSFKVGLNSGPVSTDALPLVQSGGAFTLSPSFLTTVNGGLLPDGSYVLHLQAVDTQGLSVARDLTFTLNTAPPTLTAELTNDTGTSNSDSITSDPTISGTLVALSGIASFKARLDTLPGPTGALPPVQNSGNSLPVTSASSAQTVDMAWSTVGNPGNPPDNVTIALVDGTSGYGNVNYTYQIGTYDVTNSQYTAFLNAKDPTGANALHLYSSGMGTDPVNGGIVFTAANPDGSKYSVMPGHGNQPVTYVSWFDTLRFANWLNNGQGNGDTETGSYTLGALDEFGRPINANSITRNPGATIVLPSENEWYKAAYYIPGTSSYYSFATSSSVLPNFDAPPGGDNSANYTPGGWPNPDYADAVGHVTDVGAYTSSVSPSGTYDQSGNVLQWNESLIRTSQGLSRGLRGGAFNYVWDHIASLYRDSGTGNGEYADVGFRVASMVSTDVLSLVQQNGTYTISPTLLTAINGGSLPDGSYVLHLEAVDDSGLNTELDLPFTLKTSVAAPSQLILLSSNTNNVTTVNTPTIGVTAETGSLVKLFVDNVQAAQGTATPGLQFTLGPLVDGTYQITASSTDPAGNSAISSALAITISTSPPAAVPTSASSQDDFALQRVVADSGPDLSTIASGLAAPAALSPSLPLRQPSITNTMASDVAIGAGERDYSADSIMEDWPWLEPSRMTEKPTSSQTP